MVCVQSGRKESLYEVLDHDEHRTKWFISNTVGVVQFTTASHAKRGLSILRGNYDVKCVFYYE